MGACLERALLSGLFSECPRNLHVKYLFSASTTLLSLCNLNSTLLRSFISSTQSFRLHLSARPYRSAELISVCKVRTASHIASSPILERPQRGCAVTCLGLPRSLVPCSSDRLELCSSSKVLAFTADAALRRAPFELWKRGVRSRPHSKPPKCTLFFAEAAVSPSPSTNCPLR